jgi:hypothetical protein
MVREIDAGSLVYSRDYETKDSHLHELLYLRHSPLKARAEA